MGDILRPIDIDESTRVSDLLDDVEAAGEPVLLRRGGSVVAVLVGIRSTDARRTPSDADLEAFRSASGSWTDFDDETFLREVRRARDGGVGRSAAS